MSDTTKKIFGVAIALFMFSALAGTVLANLGAINLTGWTGLSTIVTLIGTVFFVGVGVYLVAKEVGIV